MRSLFIAALLVFLAIPCTAKVSYPEVFENFITGWVEYDEGAYAASLRAFGRAQALDPDFYPARDGYIASLRRMNLPELADFYLRRTSVSGPPRLQLEEKLAFWGVFSDQDFEVTGTDSISEPLITMLRDEVALPIVEVLPTSQKWTDKQEMAAFKYNMLVMLTDNDEGLTARIHLIEAFDVESGNELDLVAPLPENTKHQHRHWAIKLGDTALPDFLKTAEAKAELRGLLFGEWQNPDAAFVVDNETKALGSLQELSSADEVISKLVTMDDAPWRHYVAAVRNRGDLETVARDCLSKGLLVWLLAITPRDAPDRPWLLGAAATFGSFGYLARWYPEHYQSRYGSNHYASELVREYPDHLLSRSLRFNQGIRELNLENYKDRIPSLLESLEIIMAAKESDLYSTYGNRYLEQLDQLLRFYIGETNRLDKYPKLPQHIYVMHPIDFRYLLALKNSEMLGQLNRELVKSYVDDIGEQEAYAREAWRMLELNALTCEGDIIALHDKHAAMLDAAPDSPFLLSGIRDIDFALRDAGHDDIIKAAATKNYERAIRMVSNNKPINAVNRALPRSKYDESLSRLLGEALEVRFRNYGEDAVGKGKLSNFLFVLSAFKIDPHRLDPVVRNTIEDLVFKELEKPRGLGSKGFERYLELLLEFKHHEAFASISLEAAPYLEKAVQSLPMADLRMWLADRTAQILTIAGHHQRALQFTQLGLEQYDLLSDREDEHTASRATRRDERRFHLWTTQAQILLKTGEHEQLQQTVATAIKLLDGRQLEYRSWTGRSQGSLGKILLTLKDQSEASGRKLGL